MDIAEKALKESKNGANIAVRERYMKIFKSLNDWKLHLALFILIAMSLIRKSLKLVKL